MQLVGDFRDVNLSSHRSINILTHTFNSLLNLQSLKGHSHSLIAHSLARDTYFGVN